ncbi:hypothetical protein CKO11_16890 [Rhodobacter sp. TJ_12]|nr:hypothetical protein [Rhodobacter sp. TJ_12]
MCGADPVPPLAGLDLVPCAGWTGGVPDTERQLTRAAAAERGGAALCECEIGSGSGGGEVKRRELLASVAAVSVAAT